MSAQNQPLVYVISPVYNGERYLRECIEAVLAQTYTNWQYTILNNCSKDRSLEIAREYAVRDPRIRVVDSDTFRGMIANFEYGTSLMPAEARYLKFAFCDDQLLPECLQQMVSIGESDPQIAIVGCYVLNGTRILSRGVPFGTQVVPGRLPCRSYLLNGESPFESLNGLMVRAEVVRRRGRLHARDDGLFEDLDVCFDLLRDAKFGFAHQVLAFNRRDNESTLSRIRNYNPMLLSDMVFLYRYAQTYLSPEERRLMWDWKSRQYWDFLARSTLKRADAGFWKFHHAGMRQMQFPFSRARLALSILRVLLDYVLNPKMSCERLFGRLKPQRPPPPADDESPGESSALAPPASHSAGKGVS